MFIINWVGHLTVAMVTEQCTIQFPIGGIDWHCDIYRNLHPLVTILINATTSKYIIHLMLLIVTILFTLGSAITKSGTKDRLMFSQEGILL